MPGLQLSVAAEQSQAWPTQAACDTQTERGDQERRPEARQAPIATQAMSTNRGQVRSCACTTGSVVQQKGGATNTCDSLHHAADVWEPGLHLYFAGLILPNIPKVWFVGNNMRKQPQGKCKSHGMITGKAEHLAGMMWAPTANRAQPGVHAQSYRIYRHAAGTGSFAHHQSDRVAGTLANRPGSTQTT